MCAFLLIGDFMKNMNEIYMEEALKEAKKAYQNDDVPVGVIIVKDGQIIARGHNKKEKNNIATEHAEIIAINKACKKINNWRLNDCIMYVTLEPCLMCAGAIIQSRIKKVIYGASNENYGYVESIDHIFFNNKLGYRIEVEKGILKEKSVQLLQSFFKEKRH